MRPWYQQEVWSKTLLFISLWGTADYREKEALHQPCKAPGNGKVPQTVFTYLENSTEGVSSAQLPARTARKSEGQGETAETHLASA